MRCSGVMVNFVFSQSLGGTRSGETKEGIPWWVVQGTQHYLKGEFQEALHCCQAAVREYPTSAWSYFGLGETLLALKQPWAALRAYGMGLRFELGSGKPGFGGWEPQGTVTGTGSQPLRVRLVGRCEELVECFLSSMEKALVRDERWGYWAVLSDFQELEKTLGDWVDEVPEIGRRMLEFKKLIVGQLLAPGMTQPEMGWMFFGVQMEIFRRLNKARLDPSLIAMIQQIDWEKRRFDKCYAEMLHYVQKNSRLGDEDWSAQVQKTVAGRLKADEFHHDLLHSAIGKFSLNNAASFMGSTVMRSRKKQLRGKLPGDELLRKDRAYHFMKVLGYQIPLNADRVLRLTEIEPQENVVIKPLSEANCQGAYMVKKGYEILDLARREQLQDWSALMASLQEDLREGRVEEDQWIVQELIYEDIEKNKPARDFKLYCFYGKVAYIWELSRFPDYQFCFWNANSERIEPGLMRDVKRFVGDGVTREQMELAASISAKIPTPFIRIDFLRGWQGFVFCEFALLPGPYAGIEDWLNRALGDFFLDAEARLMEDLLAGKQFEEYWRFRKDLGLEDGRSLGLELNAPRQY